MSAFDCQSCGACCYNPSFMEADYFIEVNVRSPLLKTDDVSHKYTYVKNGKHYMRLVGETKPRCIALRGRLGKSVSCSVYDSRPSVCKKVLPGSRECIEDREALGIKS